MSGAFRSPSSNQHPHAGVIAHSSLSQVKHSEPPADSVNLYRYYIEQLALQNRALLLQPTPLISSIQQPGHPAYFNNNLLHLANTQNQLFVSGFQPSSQATLLANTEQINLLRCDERRSTEKALDLNGFQSSVHVKHEEQRFSDPNNNNSTVPSKQLNQKAKKCSKETKITQSAPKSTKQNQQTANNSELFDSLLCVICNDKASGIHYGVYSCEGCKGFFKRAVQNKKVYSCVGGAEASNCTIIKEKRNACQFCRLQKCLQQGMIIEAVRENRMPGGRSNSIYNLYRLKYRKPRKTPTDSTPTKQEKMQPDTSNDQHCKPSQAEYQHLDAPIRKNLIQELIEIDRLEDLINLRGLRIHNEQQNVVTSPCQRLSKIGDEIVEQLVEWTKLLPFYAELPVEIHTLLLTQRWAELVLLSACFYAHCTVSNDPNTPNVSFSSSAVNLQLLQQRLSAVMNKEIPLEHVQKEAGPLVEKFTDLLQSFSRLRITLEAYVCLKAITLLHFSQTNQDLEHVFDCSAGHMNSSYQRKVSLIQDQFVKALQIHMSQCYEDGPRLSDILTWLPMLHSASSVLLHSKMFYVPFLICKQPEHLNDSVVPRPIQANPIPKTISTSSLKLEPEETDCSSSETSAMRDHSMAQDS